MALAGHLIDMNNQSSKVFTLPSEPFLKMYTALTPHSYPSSLVIVYMYNPYFLFLHWNRLVKKRNRALMKWTGRCEQLQPEPLLSWIRA